MRIISGIYGHRRFQPPPAFEARPTTDFAKENLFNVLTNLIDFETLTALDLFAGTGSITFELLSRGCPRVTAVEQHPLHAAFIARTAAALGVGEAFTLLRTDVFRYLRPRQTPLPDAFDFVFADPPYNLSCLSTLPALLLQSPRLSVGALLILEHPKACDFSAHASRIDHRAYGSVNFSFFRKH